MNQNETNEEERKMKEMRTTIEKQEDRIQKLQSTAFQLANFYFIFQGVIFTVISNGNSSLRCKDWWFPLILSLIAASLNLCALLMIGVKYKRSLEQQDLNWCDYEQHEKIRLEQRSGHPQTSSSNNNNNGNTRIQLNRDPFTKHQRNAYLFLCMSLFIGFSLLTFVGCWMILCKGGNEFKKLKGAAAVDDDDECVMLCDGGKCIRVCPLY
ncbi:hypothetical protein ACSBR2_036987 [Camellia fascicularis]